MCHSREEEYAVAAQGRMASSPVGIKQGKLPGRGPFALGLNEWKGFSWGREGEQKGQWARQARQCRGEAWEG